MVFQLSKAINALMSLVLAPVNVPHRHGSISNASEMLRRYRALLMLGGRSLDLGCGPAIKSPFGAAELCGVDIRGDLNRSIHRLI